MRSMDFPITVLRLLSEAEASSASGEVNYADADTPDYSSMDEEHFGTNITFADLYASVVFLATIYSVGLFFSRFLGMPSLVGEILVGILMGPNMYHVVPNAEAFVLLGEIGLVLLVLEAGIDIDLTTLRLVGTRGALIAVVGSILPVGLAIAISYSLGYTGTTAIAAGCTFAPTSLGIAMNVLRRAGIANTPIGQLIVAAAIIDDMLALVILSQLEAFTGEDPSIMEMVIPIVSAIGFLVVGGAIAIFLLPKFLDEYILDPLARTGKIDRDWLSLALMFGFLLLLLPVTYDAKASPLMGAFLAGLVFCTNQGAHHMYVSQFKRLMQWLMRIFFAASIGFQVPFRKFGNPTVILQGLFFTVALLGKVAVGFLVPNFMGSKRFNYTHLRDCLVVGFSMSAEGEFAFVIAVFGVAHDMIPQDLYASVVLAVLLSTIIGPFCLTMTIKYFNKRIESEVFGATEDGGTDSKTDLAASIRENTAVFWCIQTKSAPAWGLLTGIVGELTTLNLDVIDHRSWHPRRSDDTLLNEIYLKDDSLSLGNLSREEAEERLKERKTEIKTSISSTIDQTDAIVRVQRWVPQIDHKYTTNDEDVTEHIQKATKDALKASMFKHDELPTTPPPRKIDGIDESPLRGRPLRRMDPSGDGLQRRSSRGLHGGVLGYRVIQIGHIDDMFTGKLEGLFRHDLNDTAHFINIGGYNDDYNDDAMDQDEMEHVEDDEDDYSASTGVRSRPRINRSLNRPLSNRSLNRPLSNRSLTQGPPSRRSSRNSRATTPTFGMTGLDSVALDAVAPCRPPSSRRTESWDSAARRSANVPDNKDIV